jgi:hypothetical protein
MGKGIRTGIPIREEAYRLYKKDWVSRHITDEQKRTAQLAYMEYLRDCMRCGEDGVDYETWISYRGYAGSCYACFGEFLDAEYQDEQYMRSLLTEPLYRLYLADTGRAEAPLFTAFDAAFREILRKGGLTRTDMMDLMDRLACKEAVPLELGAQKNETSAMGFLNKEFAQFLEFDYEGSGFHDFIAEILDDTENENPEGQYMFIHNGKLVPVYLSRMADDLPEN